MYCREQEIKEIHQVLKVAIRDGNLAEIPKATIMLSELEVHITVPFSPIKSVYVAHNLGARWTLREMLLPHLYQNGFVVYSSWIWDDLPDGYHACITNCNDMIESDYMLMFAKQFGEVPGRGKYGELGMAIALNKRIVVVGDKGDNNCIWYYHPNVAYVGTTEAAITIFKKLTLGESTEYAKTT